MICMHKNNLSLYLLVPIKTPEAQNYCWENIPFSIRFFCGGGGGGGGGDSYVDL